MNEWMGPMAEVERLRVMTGNVHEGCEHDAAYMRKSYEIQERLRQHFRNQDAALVRAQEQVAQRDELLLSWHMTHGYKDERSRAESFADCPHRLCIKARAALADTAEVQA